MKKKLLILFIIGICTILFILIIRNDKVDNNYFSNSVEVDTKIQASLSSNIDNNYSETFIKNNNKENTKYINIEKNQKIAITETNTSLNEKDKNSSNNTNIDRAIEEEIINENIIMTIIEKSITKDSVSVYISYPDDNTYNWSNSFRILKKDGENWTELPIKFFNKTAPLDRPMFERWRKSNRKRL